MPPSMMYPTEQTPVSPDGRVIYPAMTDDDVGCVVDACRRVLM